MSVVVPQPRPVRREPSNSGVIARTAVLGSLQFLSPAAALLAEMALAWRFGASGVVDAYRVTVLLLLYGQQMFVTSILPFVLVPIFAECRAQGREEDAWKVADSAGRLVLLFGIAIAAFMFFRPELTTSFVAPGLSAPVRAIAITFIRWCGLAFIPLCWTGAACGILYAHNVFEVAPLAQLASNLIVMLAIVAGATRLGPASLIVGVLGGAVASTAMYSIKVAQLRKRAGYRSPLLSIDIPSLRKALRIAAPLIGSVIAGQSTSIVVNRVLSRLPVGTLAAFGYAWKMGALVQLMPSALSIVLFPRFSETWYSKGPEHFAADCARAFRSVLYIALPLTFVCRAFRIDIVALLFHRGAFSSADVAVAGLLFGLMILNGPAASVSASLGRSFYAIQAPRFPVMMDITGNCLELLFVPLLAARYGAAGVAFAYMLLPWFTGTGLLTIYARRFRTFPLRDLAAFALQATLVGAAAAWAGAAASAAVSGGASFDSFTALLRVASGAGLALMLYFGATLMLRFPEALTLARFAANTSRSLRARFA
jgi:putative peptidoglycan lipid II flippase